MEIVIAFTIAWGGPPVGPPTKIELRGAKARQIQEFPPRISDPYHPSRGYNPYNRHSPTKSARVAQATQAVGHSSFSTGGVVVKKEEIESGCATRATRATSAGRYHSLTIPEYSHVRPFSFLFCTSFTFGNTRLTCFPKLLSFRG